MILGSHLSIAGSLEAPLLSAEAMGFQTAGMFLRNQRQWSARPLDERTVRRFRLTRRRVGVGPLVAHGSYLVNLAGLAAVRKKSIAAMIEDLGRCGRLGVEYLVLHPGSRKSAAAGIRLIAAALNTIVAACPRNRARILLETTAGQGNSIGHTFEQLADILSRLDRPRRFGVCLDTCHIFAAGYDIRTPKAYERTMAAFDEVIGIERLPAIHLNDSVGALGGRLDRHAHIGAGYIGRRGFANFVNDPRLASVAMILETPKGQNTAGRDWDAVNAQVLRKLVKNRRPPRGRPTRR